MTKSVLKVSLLAILMTGSMTFVSCKGKKAAETDEVTEQESKVADRSVDVSIFSSMPVDGANADYFSISGPNGSSTVKLTGTPDDESYSGNKGIVKATIDVSVLKSLNDEVHEWGGYSGPKLVILDENHEEITKLSIAKTDKQLLEAELAKPTPGKVSVIFKTDVYDKEYNKIFDKAKYVQLQGLEMKGKKEAEREEKMAEAEREKARAAEAKASKSSVSSSSSSDDDDDYDDPGEKSRWQKVKDKVKDKTQGIREKATEKLDEWLDD